DATWVATFVAVTATPGRRPPDPSVILPVIPPRKSWAFAVATRVASSTTTSTHTRFINALPSTPSAFAKASARRRPPSPRLRRDVVRVRQRLRRDLAEAKRRRAHPTP